MFSHCVVERAFAHAIPLRGNFIEIVSIDGFFFLCKRELTSRIISSCLFCAHSDPTSAVTVQREISKAAVKSVGSRRFPLTRKLSCK